MHDNDIFRNAVRLANSGELKKQWQPQDFGQGQKDGGTKIHRQNRYEFILRAQQKSAADDHHLTDDEQKGLERNLIALDVLLLRRQDPKSAMGHSFWLNVCEPCNKPKKGMFVQWYRETMALSKRALAKQLAKC